MLTVYYTRWWIKQRFITVCILIINTTYSHYYWCVYVVYPNMMTIQGAMFSLGTRGGGFYPRGGYTTIWTDKYVFFKSMLRHVKRVTHWKPTQNFKFKLVNILKSYSQHNHQVYFRNKFCFISSKLYLIFTTQWLICAALIHCKIYRPVLIFVFNKPFTHIYFNLI